MLIENLRNFLNKCKTHGESNFLTLQGGKFNIPSDKSREFIDLYLKASSEFTESDNTSLVWRPTSDRFKPLHFDIDIQLLTDILLPNDKNDNIILLSNDRVTILFCYQMIKRQSYFVIK